MNINLNGVVAEDGTPFVEIKIMHGFVAATVLVPCENWSDFIGHLRNNGPLAVEDAKREAKKKANTLITNPAMGKLIVPVNGSGHVAG